MSDLELQKAHVKVTYPVLISALVSVILGVFLLAGSYFSVLEEIRAGRKEALKIQQFQGWLDEFRVRNESTCVSCDAKACTVCCPAGCWRADPAGGIELVVDGCLECGTCRLICDQNNVDWNYPRGGFGILFKFG